MIRPGAAWRRPDQADEGIGGRALETVLLRAERMSENQKMGVEAEPAQGIAAGSVAGVSGDRVARFGEMDPDLVFTPGFEP